MSPTASPTTSRSSTSNRSRRRSPFRLDACPGASPSCRKGGWCERLGHLEARFLGRSRRGDVTPKAQDRFLDRRVEPVAPGIDIGEDRAAHPRVPEFLDVIGDSGNDVVLALIGEELADLVRHIDEAVGRHRAGLSGYSAATRRSAMRRLCRVSSSYSSCHSNGPFDGLTCTAVTLYSGQLVAQSKNSVVTTFTCMVGWWKVV